MCTFKNTQSRYKCKHEEYEHTHKGKAANTNTNTNIHELIANTKYKMHKEGNDKDTYNDIYICKFNDQSIQQIQNT